MYQYYIICLNVKCLISFFETGIQCVTDWNLEDTIFLVTKFFCYQTIPCKRNSVIYKLVDKYRLLYLLDFYFWFVVTFNNLWVEILDTYGCCKSVLDGIQVRLQSSRLKNNKHLLISFKISAKQAVILTYSYKKTAFYYTPYLIFILQVYQGS